MLVGTGVDLCEVDRIKAALLSSHGDRLRQRVFTQLEIAYAESKANKFERYAARFAAKEAGMKALGTGWRNGVSWHDFEVANLPGGRPTLRLRGKAGEIAAQMGVTNVVLSLTHTEIQAMALVILESLPSV